MRGVPKIVIIENKSEEAQPLADVLSKLGLPFVHYRGKAAGCLPPQPLEGVRVLFLDFHLGGAEGTGDKMIESAAIGHLEAVVSKNNGPWILLTWTSRWQAGNKEGFLEKVKKAGLFPASITVLEDKKELLGKPAELLAAITKALKDLPAIYTLIEWEHAAADAAVTTVNRVFALPEGKIADLADVRQRLSALARAELGEQSATVSGAERAAAAMRVLNGVLADRIERQLPAGQEISVEHVTDEGGAYAAVVNECLLFAQCPPKTDDPVTAAEAKPKDIPTATALPVQAVEATAVSVSKGVDAIATAAAAQPAPAAGAAVPAPLPPLTVFPSAVYDFPSDEVLVEMGLPKRDAVVDSWGKFKKSNATHLTAAKQNWEMVLLDVTPICDHAQPKPRIRVVVGVLVKHDFTPWVPGKWPAYFTALAPSFNFGAAPHPMKLLVDTSLLVSPARELLGKLTPLCLMRAQLLTEIQQKISDNLSRAALTFVV